MAFALPGASRLQGVDVHGGLLGYLVTSRIRGSKFSICRGWRWRFQALPLALALPGDSVGVGVGASRRFQATGGCRSWWITRVSGCVQDTGVVVLDR